jgi:glycosyltransferase involved in cell wall biosynthesis
MATGLPVVASDLAVHREICRDAAVYFSPFSHQELADGVCGVAGSPHIFRAMKEKGLRRASAFSWKQHVEELIKLAQSLVQKRAPAGLQVSVGAPQ